MSQCGLFKTKPQPRSKTKRTFVTNVMKRQRKNWIPAVDGSLGPCHLHSSPQFLRSHPNFTVQYTSICNVIPWNTVVCILDLFLVHPYTRRWISQWALWNHALGFHVPSATTNIMMILQPEENVKYQDWSVSWCLTQRESWSSHMRCFVMESILMIHSSLSQWMRFCS